MQWISPFRPSGRLALRGAVTLLPKPSAFRQKKIGAMLSDKIVALISILVFPCHTMYVSSGKLQTFEAGALLNGQVIYALVKASVFPNQFRPSEEQLLLHAIFDLKASVKLLDVSEKCPMETLCVIYVADSSFPLG